MSLKFTVVRRTYHTWIWA